MLSDIEDVIYSSFHSTRPMHYAHWLTYLIRQCCGPLPPGAIQDLAERQEEFQSYDASQLLRSATTVTPIRLGRRPPVTETAAQQDAVMADIAEQEEAQLEAQELGGAGFQGDTSESSSDEDFVPPPFEPRQHDAEAGSSRAMEAILERMDRSDRAAAERMEHQERATAAAFEAIHARQDEFQRQQLQLQQTIHQQQMAFQQQQLEYQRQFMGLFAHLVQHPGTAPPLSLLPQPTVPQQQQAPALQPGGLQSQLPAQGQGTGPYMASIFASPPQQQQQSFVTPASTPLHTGFTPVSQPQLITPVALQTALQAATAVPSTSTEPQSQTVAAPVLDTQGQSVAAHATTSTDPTPTAPPLAQSEGQPQDQGVPQGQSTTPDTDEDTSGYIVSPRPGSSASAPPDA